MGAEITVAVRFFGTLAKEYGNSRSVALLAPATVLDLMLALGIDESKVSLCLVNNAQVRTNHPLCSGDSVMIVPAVIGG